MLARMCADVIKRQFHNVVEWKAPHWCKSLKNVPTHKVQLCQADTPIHPWCLPGVPDGFQVSIKRDDMTGSTLSGNKVRKLEFLFADALRAGSGHVITCGGVQSNFCRATAGIAAQLGLKCHLLLRSDIKSPSEAGCSGNLLLDQLFGAHVYFVPRTAKYETELKPRMEKLAEHLKKTTGKTAYLMEVGGSDDIGVFGYIQAFEEMMQQGATEQFSDVVFACGSGGTAEGLSAANTLSASNMKIHGVSVCDESAYFYRHADRVFTSVGVPAKATDVLDIIDGYKGAGYGVSTDSDLDFIHQVAKMTGIVLDPTYTGKAVQGMLAEMASDPDRFQGRNVLFLHTGGIFGAFDGKLEDRLTQQQNNGHMWTETQNLPF